MKPRKLTAEERVIKAAMRYYRIYYGTTDENYGMRQRAMEKLMKACAALRAKGKR